MNAPAPGGTVLYEARGAVALLTLNRPDALNSFTRQMHQELWAALDQAVDRLPRVEGHGGEVQVVDLAQGEGIPDDILDALTDESVTKWAFNASFERVCLSRYLIDLGMSLDPFHDHHPLSQDCARFLNPAGWKCSMVWSAYMGLPLSLEGAGIVLKLDSQKMKEGKDLIRYFCMPCKPTKANGGRTRNLPSDAPEKWELFKTYCIRDVDVEKQIKYLTQRNARL